MTFSAFTRSLALFVIATALASAKPDDPVLLKEQGPQVTLANGNVSITVNKADATIPIMTLNGSANLAGRGGYFAVANSVGRDGGDLHNAEFAIVRNTPDIAEISMGAPVGGIFFTVHYIVRRGDQGFYVFVEQQRKTGARAEGTGQVRWSFYLNNDLFNYHLASDSEQDPIPDLKGARQVQDATYRLPNGTVYTKYNYCVYLEDDLVHGICGTGPNAYGAFVISPGREYLQAPTKQEISVHAGPIIHRFLQSGHFEPRDESSQKAPEGWKKACGPWFVYLNTGDNPQTIWADAKARARQENSQWPYQWMQHPDYPLERGEVRGTLRLYDGAQPAANALMVLTAPSPDWQLQVLNYIFSARADADGHFILPHVRPGTYTLFAAVPGVTDEFRRDNITVTANGTLDLGTIVFAPPYYSCRLWELGVADRRTTGFNLSERRRQYGLDQSVPSDLTYTIGQSLPSRDWYYAQAKQGDWKITFNLDREFHGQGVLTIGIAGQTRDPQLEVYVNGKFAGEYSGGNSSALYRSAILGSSFSENKILRFPASVFRRGANTVTLRLNHGSVMYDVIKLEVDDPDQPKQIPTVVTKP